MIEELVDLVDRQFKFLARQEGEMFFRELRRTLTVLYREPRLAAVPPEPRVFNP